MSEVMRRNDVVKQPTALLKRNTMPRGVQRAIEIIRVVAMGLSLVATPMVVTAATAEVAEAKEEMSDLEKSLEKARGQLARVRAGYDTNEETAEARTQSLIDLQSEVEEERARIAVLEEEVARLTGEIESKDIAITGRRTALDTVVSVYEDAYDKSTSLGDNNRDALTRLLRERRALKVELREVQERLLEASESFASNLGVIEMMRQNPVDEYGLFLDTKEQEERMVAIVSGLAHRLDAERERKEARGRESQEEQDQRTRDAELPDSVRDAVMETRRIGKIKKDLKGLHAELDEIDFTKERKASVPAEEILNPREAELYRMLQDSGEEYGKYIRDNDGLTKGRLNLDNLEVNKANLGEQLQWIVNFWNDSYPSTPIDLDDAQLVVNMLDGYVPVTRAEQLHQLARHGMVLEQESKVLEQVRSIVGSMEKAVGGRKCSIAQIRSGALVARALIDGAYIGQEKASDSSSVKLKKDIRFLPTVDAVLERALLMADQLEASGDIVCEMPYVRNGEDANPLDVFDQLGDGEFLATMFKARFWNMPEGTLSNDELSLVFRRYVEIHMQEDGKGKMSEEAAEELAWLQVLMGLNIAKVQEMPADEYMRVVMEVEGGVNELSEAELAVVVGRVATTGALIANVKANGISEEVILGKDGLFQLIRDVMLLEQFNAQAYHNYMEANPGVFEEAEEALTDPEVEERVNAAVLAVVNEEVVNSTSWDAVEFRAYGTTKQGERVIGYDQDKFFHSLAAKDAPELASSDLKARLSWVSNAVDAYQINVDTQPIPGNVRAVDTLYFFSGDFRTVSKWLAVGGSKMTWRPTEVDSIDDPVADFVEWAQIPNLNPDDLDAETRKHILARLKETFEKGV